MGDTTSYRGATTITAQVQIIMQVHVMNISIDVIYTI